MSPYATHIFAELHPAEIEILDGSFLHKVVFW